VTTAVTVRPDAEIAVEPVAPSPNDELAAVDAGWDELGS
jgi:hypothetical protein